MAVVGEAHIIVRAITTSVKDDIKKGFNGVDKVVSESGKSISKSFSNDFARGAEGALKSFQKLTKTGYILQTALGTIVGALSSLVGAAGALAGSVGGAAGSIGAFAGVLAALPAGLATFKLALGGVGQAVSAAVQANKNYANSVERARNELKQLQFDAEAAALGVRRAGLSLEQARENLLAAQQLPPNSRARREAELAYEEADLAYRRAQEQADAAEKAKKKAASAGGGGADPFANLNDSQKKFAKYLVTLQPLIKDLKAAASGSLLPILQDQIDRLVNGTKGTATFFEVIRNGIKRTSVGLGAGITKFVDALTSPKNLANLEAVFKGIQPVFETFGKVFGSLFGSFLTITKAAFPATKKFLTFIDGKTKAFENFLDTKAASGELSKFFTRATKLAGDLGQVLGNIGSFFGDIIKANFGPATGGQYLLNWLKTATDGWKSLDERVGKSEFSNYFFSASVNAKAVLQSVGKLVKELGKLGTNRDIKATFDVLAEGAPFIGQILAEGAKAGPILARLIVNITKMVAALSDAGGPRVFFGVLNTAAQFFADLLQNEVVMNITKIVGLLTAVGLAVGVLKGIFVFAGSVMAGALLPVIARFMGIEVAALKAQIASSKFMMVARGAGPWVMAAAAITFGVIALNDELIRARKESLTTGESIRGMLANGANPVNVMNEALKDLNGTLIFSKTTYADFNLGGKYAVVTTKDWSYSISDITTNAETFTQTIKLLGNQVDNLEKRNIGTQDWFDDEEQWYRVEQQFVNIGTALSDLAKSDLPTAQKGFQGIVKQFNLSDEAALDLLNSLGPEFKTSLTDLSLNANGLTDDMSLLDLAMGRGSKSADAVAVQLYGVDGAAKAAKIRIQELKDKIFNFGSVTLDTRAAAREFERAIDDVTASVIENGKGLDITTEAGRNNSAALDTLVTSGKDFANSMFEQNGNSKELQTNMINLRQKVEDAAVQMGLGKDAAKELADQLVGSKYDIKMNVKSITKDEAERATTELRKIVTEAGKAGFRVTAADLARLYPQLVDQAAALNQRYGGYINTFGSGIRRFAPGGPVFGSGTGTSDSIPAMLSNGEFVVNANATAKNRSLLEQINSGNASAGGGNTINLVVNPGPDMDIKELAAEVSRRLAFTMRKGAAI